MLFALDDFYSERLFEPPILPRSGDIGRTLNNCCVPGKARLLIGDARDCDTGPEQSPYPAWRRRRVAKGKRLR